MTEIWDLLVFEDLCLVSFLSCESMHEEIREEIRDSCA